MKKVIFSFLLIGITAGAMAQKAKKFDKNDFQKFFITKQYADAKTLIDQVLENPKEQDNKDALTYKAVIYAALANDSATTKDSAAEDLKVASGVLNQLQQSTDTAQFNKLMREDMGINAVSAVYAGSFNDGKVLFGKSDWEPAYHSFYTAFRWANYIMQSGFSTNPDRSAIDTFTTLYTGFAAQNASGFDTKSGFKNPVMADSAMSIYTMMADRNIAIPDMAAAYQFMVQYYQYKKDKDSSAKYLALAKKYYPTRNDLWNSLETDAILEGGVASIIQNYKEKDAAGGMTEDQYSQIAQTLATAEKKDQDDSTQALARATAIDAYEKAFNLGHNGLNAFNVGVLYYQQFSALDDDYFKSRGETAALKAKRAAIEKKQFPLSDSAVVWLTNGVTTMSAKADKDQYDKMSLNRAVDMLANLYNWKMGKAQGRDPGSYDKYLALFKKYDAMHDSFK